MIVDQQRLYVAMVRDVTERKRFEQQVDAEKENLAVTLRSIGDGVITCDVNGKVITPVAELVKARNRPFIFATGYGSSGLPQEYRDRPALQKPFQLETLAQVINSTLKNAAV